MTVPPAAVMKKLFARSAGGQRRIPQPQSRDAAIRFGRVRQTDRPAQTAVGRLVARRDHAAVPAVKQKIVQSLAVHFLGDPIEREPERVKRDLEQGLTTEEIATGVYCVNASPVPESHEWQVNEAATRRRREEKRRERLQRAVPVEEWWRRSRQRLLDGNLDPLLAEMYASSMKQSRRFEREFRNFWALSDDARFEVQ